MGHNIEQLERKYEAAREKEREAYHELIEARIQGLSERFTGEYIKYYCELRGYPEYMYVMGVHYYPAERKYVINGYGFSGEFDEYSNWFSMDYCDDIEIYGIPDTIEEQISNRIIVIDETEFDQAFMEFSQKAINAHRDKMEALRKKNEKTV